MLPRQNSVAESDRETVLRLRRERKEAQKEAASAQPRRWVVRYEGDVFGRAFGCTQQSAMEIAMALYPELNPACITLEPWEHAKKAVHKTARAGFLIRPELLALRNAPSTPNKSQPERQPRYDPRHWIFEPNELFVTREASFIVPPQHDKKELERELKRILSEYRLALWRWAQKAAPGMIVKSWLDIGIDPPE